MYLSRLLVTGTACFTLFSCALDPLSETDDPEEMLAWAENLYDKQEKPVPAELLIQKAIKECQRESDNECLGQAYMNYGFFFRSPTIRKWEDHYRDKGFLDKTATYENRLEKSREYFAQSVTYYEKTDNYSSLSKAYLNLGFAYYFVTRSYREGKVVTGGVMPADFAQCMPYTRSLEYNQKALKKNPNIRINLPADVSSFKEYVDIHLKRAGCIE